MSYIYNVSTVCLNIVTYIFRVLLNRVSERDWQIVLTDRISIYLCSHPWTKVNTVFGHGAVYLKWLVFNDTTINVTNNKICHRFIKITIHLPRPSDKYCHIQQSEYRMLYIPTPKKKIEYLFLKCIKSSSQFQNLSLKLCNVSLSNSSK